MRYFLYETIYVNIARVKYILSRVGQYVSQDNIYSKVIADPRVHFIFCREYISHEYKNLASTFPASTKILYSRQYKKHREYKTLYSR